jgi:ADP-heptose:LPS heptosyltransferase
MGGSVEDKMPEVHFSNEDKEIVEKLLQEIKMDENGIAGKGRWVVLHPFAGARSKEWPICNFQSLIDRLKDEGRAVLLVGSKNDRGVFENTTDLKGRVTLPQLACLIKAAGMFIGLDSGPANIAAALNVPSVIICSGTNVPQLWIPAGSNVRFVYKDTGCKPCGDNACPKEKHECMDGISVDEVITAVKGLGQ